MRYIWLTLRHKWFVFRAGIKINVPIILLILHDWTKFMPVEAPHYQRQFYGNASDPLGFSYAWLHHQRNNKHHWEYWIPISGHNRGGYKDMEALPMPEKYVREMIADWMGACRSYEGFYPDGKWTWWENNKEKILSHCNPQTSKMILELLVTTNNEYGSK